MKPKANDSRRGRDSLAAVLLVHVGLQHILAPWPLQQALRLLILLLLFSAPTHRLTDMQQEELICGLLMPYSFMGI